MYRNSMKFPSFLKGRVSKGLRKVQERHRAALVAAVVRERPAVRLFLTGFPMLGSISAGRDERQLLQILAKFWRARFRLHGSRFLRLNIHFARFFRL